jgi:hypothetical protein
MSRLSRGHALLAGLPLILILGCGGGSNVNSVPPPNAGDSNTGTTGSSYAQFDPSNSVIPLPNVLLTATTTSVTYTATPTPSAGALNVNPGYPLTPDKALAFLDQKETGGAHAVAGVNAPIYIAFSATLSPSTVNSNNIKIFRMIPDTPTNPSSLENTVSGFQDVSASFSYQILASGKEIYAMPQVPMLPGSRYVYVVTDGVKDSLGNGMTGSTTFSILKYVKGGATSAASDTTNLADLTDPTNPAAIAGASGAALLESIAGNVTVSSNIVFSGYRKTMWDLIANAAADTSGKTAAGAGATGITARSHIALMGRFITTGHGFTAPDPVGNATSRIPVETALWGWANNADLSSGIPGANFSTGESRAWTNTVSNFAAIASSAVADPGAGSIGSIFGSIPHSNVGLVAWGTFEGANLPMDPYVTQQNLASAGGNLDAATTATNVLTSAPMGAYNPGTSTIPGSGALIGFRNGTGVLRGYYHTTRTVPFVIITPKTGSGPYPIAIFMHGISRSKEDVLAMADSACAAGYAVISIDQAVHGFPAGATGSLTPTGVTTGGGNGRPQAEWASNFFMLPSSLTARANVYQSAFNLWRLERILKQPTADPNSLQTAMSTAGKSIATTGASKYISQSLGSIVGSVFLAGNSSQTGGSNMKGFLSVPGGRLAFILHDSPAFKSTVDAGLAAAGVPTNSPSYNAFFTLAQSVIDSADPASMTTPLPGQSASRLAGRVVAQEAVGDAVIPNTNGRYFINALAGRLPQLGGDVSGGFTQVAPAATPAVPYVFGSSFSTIKTAVIPAVGAAVVPTQGVYQYGTTTTVANHGLLLDGSSNTAAAQTQMGRWLATGLITDGTAAYPIMVPLGPETGAVTILPEHLKVYFPTVQP